MGKGGGISKSDLQKTANTPRKKNSTGGLRILNKIRLPSIN
ncbi:conserved hypothetical protein [Planktothrix rubescens CCAP 1459/22]|uniref:Uncharacterized protein n=1 Tax=Planktothrix rubescens CCAP 1459/22 TaxID=329571 RepID=A0A6J7ZP49_PLARU|nr:conserved hypothetical protein [Planktothrix rubescens NIVA-CYA 18]